MDDGNSWALAKRPDKLSKRQEECLHLAGEGLTSKEIGRELEISPSTVDNHIQAACDRLRARNRTDAIRIYRGISGKSDKDVRISQYEAMLIRPVENPPETESDEALNWLKPAPIGGRKNEFPTSKRIFHVVQIAVFSVISVTAAILTIAGLVHILSS